MRQIKFRGQRLDNKQWVYGNLISISKELSNFTTELTTGIQVIENGNFKAVFQVSAETVGQFTGLTDKNGKEIYEGDIIPYSGYFKSQHKTKSFNSIVVYTEYGKFELQFPNGNTSGNIWEYVIHEEVIATIHDNPEPVKN